jgi:HK97 gp10 family phage protein
MSAELIINGDPFKGVIDGNEQSLIEISERVVSEAKNFAPVDKGQLANGIMYKTSIKEGGFNDSGGEDAEKKISAVPQSGESFVGTAVEHGIYQEFGTKKIAPNPFMRPSLAIVVKNQDSKTVIKKVNKERMLGALKKGQKRIKF